MRDRFPCAHAAPTRSKRLRATEVRRPVPVSTENRLSRPDQRRSDWKLTDDTFRSRTARVPSRIACAQQRRVMATVTLSSSSSKSPQPAPPSLFDLERGTGVVADAPIVLQGPEDSSVHRRPRTRACCRDYSQRFIGSTPPRDRQRHRGSLSRCEVPAELVRTSRLWLPSATPRLPRDNTSTGTLESAGHRRCSGRCRPRRQLRDPAGLGSNPSVADRRRHDDNGVEHANVASSRDRVTADRPVDFDTVPDEDLPVEPLTRTQARSHSPATTASRSHRMDPDRRRAQTSSWSADLRKPRRRVCRRRRDRLLVSRRLPFCSIPGLIIRAFELVPRASLSHDGRIVGHLDDGPSHDVLRARFRSHNEC